MVKRFILFLIALYTPNVSFGQELSWDSLVHQYFTDAEIVQLDKLLSSFEEQILFITEEEDLQQRYLAYLKGTACA